MTDMLKIVLIVAATALSALALWLDEPAVSVIVFGWTMVLLFRDRKII